MATASLGPLRPTELLTRNLRNRWLIVAVVVVVGGGIAGYVGVHAFVSLHTFSLVAVPVLLLPIAGWLFFSERYEYTLGLLLLYLGLADGVVKLSNGSSIGTLGRDVLLYSISFGALVRLVIRRRRVRLPSETWMIVAWVAVVLVQVANPDAHGTLHSLAALRQHLEFVPLFFFGFAAVRTKRRLAGFLLILVVIAGANGVVNVIQTRLTPAQLATWGPGYAGIELGTNTGAFDTHNARVFVTSSGRDAVRPLGLGGEDGFGGNVGLIAVPAVIALLGAAKSNRGRAMLLIFASLVLVGVVTSQARSVLLGAVLTLFAFGLLTVNSRRGFQSLAVLGVVLAIGYGIGSAFIGSNSNRYSTIAPSKVGSTVVSQREGTISLIPSYLRHYPLGAGLGTAGAAASSSVGGYTATTLNGESEFTFLIVETGIPGLFVMLLITIAAARAGLKLRRVVDPELQRYLMALTAVFAAFAGFWFYGAFSSTSPDAPYLWFVFGVFAYWGMEVRGGKVPTRATRRVEAPGYA